MLKICALSQIKSLSYEKIGYSIEIIGRVRLEYSHYGDDVDINLNTDYNYKSGDLNGEDTETFKEIMYLILMRIWNIEV